MGKFQSAKEPLGEDSQEEAKGDCKARRGWGWLSARGGGVSTHTAAQGPEWPVRRAGGPCGLRLCRKRSRLSGPAPGPVFLSTSSGTGPASNFAVAFSSPRGAGGVVSAAGAAVAGGAFWEAQKCCFHWTRGRGWRVTLPSASVVGMGLGSSQAILLLLPRRAWLHSAGDSSVHIVTFC